MAAEGSAELVLLDKPVKQLAIVKLLLQLVRLELLERINVIPILVGLMLKKNYITQIVALIFLQGLKCTVGLRLSLALMEPDAYTVPAVVVVE